jgi:hypothetical protein
MDMDVTSRAHAEQFLFVAQTYLSILLKLADVDGLRPSPADPFYAEIQGRPRETLKRRFAALRDEAMEILERLGDATHAHDEQPALEVTIETQIY